MTKILIFTFWFGFPESSMMDISKEEMYTYGYQAAMHEMKRKEEIPPPFMDDPSFTEMWTKIESKVS